MPDACAHCKTGADGTGKLKLCAKCKSTSYCSRECQKAHWKVHKKDCARGFGGSSSSASGQSSLPGGRTQGITGDALLNAISGGLFDGLSHADAYRRIIDSYRLRVEDEYVFEQSNKGIYAGEDPNPEFRDFLNKAETKKLLPAWWSRAKRAECESLSTDSRGDSYLGHAVEKHDIQEKYADSLMPLKIRVLAEKIYGRRIGV